MKLLCAPKMICYRISGNAFIDYHQFGETTSRCCVYRLVRGLVKCRALLHVYLRKPSKADARKILQCIVMCTRGARIFGCHEGALEELSHCTKRSVPRKREVCYHCIGIRSWLQCMVLACIIRFPWDHEWHQYMGKVGLAWIYAQRESWGDWSWVSLHENVFTKLFTLWMEATPPCPNFLDPRLIKQQSLMVVSKLIRRAHKRM